TSGWMRLAYLALVPVLALLVYACNPARENHEPAPAGEPAAAAPATKADTTVHSAYRITVTDEPSAETLPYGVVEQKPSFNGGDANEFSKWVNQHLNYPEAAKIADIEGRVIVQFTVDEDGSMSGIRVIRSVDPVLDAEALRVMNSCTEKWSPGIQNGKPVKVIFTFPITFQLR
nr:energy transducer TonB [Bacteroidales bacterium]